MVAHESVPQDGDLLDSGREELAVGDPRVGRGERGLGKRIVDVVLELLRRNACGRFGDEQQIGEVDPVDVHGEAPYHVGGLIPIHLHILV